MAGWHTDMEDKIWEVTCPCGESSGETDHSGAMRWASTHRCTP